MRTARRGARRRAGARVPARYSGHTWHSGSVRTHDRAADAAHGRVRARRLASALRAITGGDTPIIYRDDKLTLIESGFFRYSESISGFEGSFNNGGTKSYTFGVFEDKATGKRIAMMSTHLWWKSTHPESKDYQPHSAEARAYQIKQALTRLEEVMAKYSCPGVLVGDLNAAIGGKCLDTAHDMGWNDAFYSATGNRADTARASSVLRVGI